MKRMIAYCELHPETEATHEDVRITLGDEEVLIDACDPCKARLDKAFAPFIEAGRRPDGIGKKSRKRAMPKKEPCEYCGRPVTPGAGRGLHVKSAHPAQWDKELAKREKELVNA